MQEAVGDRGETMKGFPQYDLIIIGGGPAGQGAAEFAAFAGRRTLVIERKVLGGLVVTTGGGPTKTLREAALHLTGFRYRALYGITERPDIVMAVDHSRARTEEVSSAMQNFTHSFFVDKLGVDVIYGSAPHEWTYLYDHSPLVNNLEKYIDYNKLQPNGMPNARLIITAVNVLTSEPLIFDSSKQRITSKHILATTGYPRYYFRWVEVEKGIYAWDGSLLSNTPLREVIDASPAKDKRVFLVENYPRFSERLPANLLEVEHRIRDIMFCDKTLHNKKLAKTFTYYLRFIDELYHVIENRFDLENAQDNEQFEKIKAKYKKISERGAEVKGLYYISRDEPFPDLYENADFSIDTIKDSIRDGELKTKQVLDGYYHNQGNAL